MSFSPDETTPLFDISGLQYRYAGAQADALADLDLKVHEGEFVAVLGANGSGKSTLARLLGGLEKPTAARRALACGHDLLVEDGRMSARRDVGVLFQNPENQLVAQCVEDDVAFGPRRLGWPEAQVTSAVDTALDVVGLPPARFAERHPYALSGGEQRRLALAGVLAMRPRLLLLDEPFVSLDPGTRRQLVGILERLKAAGVTLLLATHDVDLAWALCDELLVLGEGRVVAAGPWDFSTVGGRLLAANRLREPFFVELWRRLGRDPQRAPRTAAEAAEALS